MSQLAPNLLLWIGFAIMTGAVVWALLRPLTRRSEGKGEIQDVALYRDQLAEVARDLERGVIAPVEAEAAKIEVSRRLLAAADAAELKKAAPASKRSPRAVAFLVMLAVPVLSLGIYLSLGSPDLPDEPFAPRVAGPADQLPLDALVLKVEQHLKENPADLRGWEVLGPAYIRQGNFSAAITAWSRAIVLGGETGSRFAARGEAEVLSANGVVTPAARKDFVKAVKLDAHEPRAQFYLGIADVQDGKKDAAAARWKTLLAAAPKDAPWRASVEAELRSLTNPAPGPTAEQAGAAADMTPEARQQMIEGMVSGLATRLDKNPNDLAGWLRLIRAYGVLGKHAEAEAALTRARATFATDKSALTELAAAEKALPRQ